MKINCFFFSSWPKIHAICSSFRQMEILNFWGEKKVNVFRWFFPRFITFTCYSNVICRWFLEICEIKKKYLSKTYSGDRKWRISVNKTRKCEIFVKRRKTMKTNNQWRKKLVFPFCILICVKIHMKSDWEMYDFIRSNYFIFYFKKKRKVIPMISKWRNFCAFRTSFCSVMLSHVKWTDFSDFVAAKNVKIFTRFYWILMTCRKFLFFAIIKSEQLNTTDKWEGVNWELNGKEW